MIKPMAIILNEHSSVSAASTALAPGIYNNTGK